MRDKILHGVALLVSFSMTLQLISFASAAELASESTLNQDLLNALLQGERRWVVETLAEDNWTNNPMAVAWYAQREKSMAREALDHYYGLDGNGQDNHGVYRKFVDAMYFAYHTDEYVDGLFDEAGELVSWAVGLFTGDEAKRTAETLNRTRDEIHYDNLLKEIFTQNYTASNGTTLIDVEASDATIKQLQNTVKYFSGFSGYFERYIGTVTNAADRAALTEEYVNQYALPYGDAARKSLEAVASLAGGGTSYEDRASAQLAANLATVLRLSMATPKESFLGFTYTDYLGEYLKESGLADALGAVGASLKWADTALENCQAMESIRAQRSTVAGPLGRLAVHASDDSMRQSVNNFERVMSQEYSEKFLSWDRIQTYLRQNRTLTNQIGGMLKSSLKKTFRLTEDYWLGATISKATNVIGISTWISDQAIGLKDICEKTFELLYWNDLMDAAVETYRADLADYQSAPGEDAARIVLDDLLLLQRLRLYGEKTAYALGSAPNNTWLGWVLDGEAAQQGWDALYQRNVDILMAATAVPVFTGLSVARDEIMVIEYTDAGFVARCGERRYVDLPSRLAGGGTVSGTLAIITNGHALSAGSLDLGGTGNLQVSDGTLTVGELTQWGGKLSLQNGARLLCTDRLSLGSPEILSDTGPVTLTTRDLELSGTPDCSVEAVGDVGGTGGVNTLTLNGGTQSMNGTLTIPTVEVHSTDFHQSGTLRAGTLRLQGGKASVDGSVTVTQALFGPSTAVSGGKNILLSGGALEGDRWNGDLSVQNAALNSSNISGALYDRGGTAYTGSVTVQKNLNCTGVSQLDSGSALSVYGTAWFGKAPGGGGQLKLFGDLAAAEDMVFSQWLEFLGSVPQDVSGAFTAEAVRFANEGAKVTVRDTVTVTERLENPSGKVETVKPVYLSDEAQLAGSFSGSLSALSLTLPDGGSIGGDLTLRSGGTLAGNDASVGGRLLLEGSGTVDGCTLTVGSLSSSNSLTLANSASMTVRGEASLRGTLTNPTELLARGDLLMDGLMASGALRAQGDIVTSNKVTLGALVLDGFARQVITGSSFTVGDLSIRSASGHTVKLDQTITVTGRYDNPSTNVEGGSIQSGTSTQQSVTADTTLQGAQTLNTPLVVNGSTLTVNGPLSVPGVVLTNGNLIVNGPLALTGTSTTVDETSRLTVRGGLRASSGTIALNGILEVRGDLLLGGMKLTGGELILGGDLYGSAVLQPEKLMLNGLIRQRMGADNLYTGNLTLSNVSKGGILLVKKLHYSGTFLQGTTPLFREENLIKEAN